MEVSEDDIPLDGDGASSEPGGAPEDEGSGSEGEGDQEDEIDVEDNEREGLVEDDEEEQEDEVCFNFVSELRIGAYRLQSFLPPQPRRLRRN